MNFPIEALHINPLSERRQQPSKRTFEAIGNYATSGFDITGWLPNMDKYLLENDIHPLDHYHVTGILYKNALMTVYLCGKPSELKDSPVTRMEILIEVFSADEDIVHYYEGQIDIPRGQLTY